MPREDDPLLEREAELTVIAERLKAACGGAGGLLMVEGAAGIGKSRLVSAACHRARACGMTVLDARGGELERGLPFGVVRELFEAFVRGAAAAERAALLAGAAALAAPVLGLVAEDEAPAFGGAAFGGLHGLFWMTVNLAERGPLLLAVDDAHWADDASLRFLVYLLRRVEALPILIVVAARPDEPCTDDLLLEALRANPLTWTLHPAPLSERAAAAVVRAAFSPRADAELCRACLAATGGNPLLLRMLSRALRDEGIDATSTDRERVAELAPRVVAEWVLPRLRRLPGDTAAFAGAVAVLGDRAEMRHAAALAALEIGPATRAADALAAAGILARGRPIEFVHPTVRRAVYDSLPAAEHHRAHRQAAEILDAEGALPDRIAPHLVVTEHLGDQWVVEVLRAASQQALARGAVEEASRHLQRALEEPPVPRLRADVLFELGSVAARVDMDQAYRYLEQALELAVDVRHRAGIALELARVMCTARDTRSALAVLDRAVAEVGEVDPALRVRLEAEYISVARRYPATRATACRRLQVLGKYAEPGSLAGCMLLTNLAADALEEKGAADEATRLASAALREDHLRDAGETDVALMASAVLMATDRLGAAWRMWNAELDRARRNGSIIGFAYAVTVRACLAYRCGQLADAEADARLADDILHEHRLDLMRRYSLAFLIGALVERGEVRAAAERLDAAVVPMNLSLLLDSRGRLRTAQGRFADAVEDFLASGKRLAARGTRHPGMLAWRSNAALALIHLDQSREARQLADEELDLARRLGVPRALGIALRAAGLVRGGPAGVALLEEAATVLARSSARLEQARALADYGAALRRANRRTESREPLRRALDLAVQCGAAPLADRARQDLVAAGVRPRRAASGVDALTPSELRVVRMAADGMGNRAIAQALFVTIKTVEVHLSSAYRKLDVASRAALPAALTHRATGERDMTD
ncbi:MAG TPA: AAA family ATPase [Pseudonocardia sp.]|uniref:ATP-binding protein n=1 Tax=Pseudonocardia sp. TaxID=60912 RepID=UPI002C4E2D47|nr:AAA family ATPase [Pseudonocardia sp.]HTF50419.1 AAA family ATPase [Pseudonocardia sp.]